MKAQIRIWTKDDDEPRIIERELIPEGNRFLLEFQSKELIDIHNIGRFLIEIEKALMSYKSIGTNKKKIRKNILQATKIEMPILTYLDAEKKERLSEILKDIFLMFYNISIDFSFYEKEFDFSAIEAVDESLIKDHKAVLLFSGGLDSMIGVDYCKEKYQNALLVYSDQKPKLKPLIESISQSLPESRLVMVDGPQLFSGFFTNVAGIFHMLNGSIFAYKNKAPLIIAECGVTSYQPRFGPLNDITYTTHPFTLDTCKKIFKTFLNVEITLELPFNNSTKAEMVSQYGQSDKIKLSHSCLTTNDFSGNRIIRNCGKCYACVIRRLGIIAAMEDPTDYLSNDIIGELKEQEMKKFILPLLEFCYIVLKDINLLDYPQKEKILKYKKEDLFKRFALDTFLAFHKLSSKGELPPYIKEYLSEFDKIILENRVTEINSG